VIVIFGRAVARTPACSVICGTGVGRSVGARIRWRSLGPLAAAWWAAAWSA
jgi:hypothetical protein